MKYIGIDVGASLSKTGLLSENWDEQLRDYSNKIWAHDGEARPEDYDLNFSRPENTLDLSISFGDITPDTPFATEVKAIIDSISTNRWILGNLAEDMSSTHQSLASDTLKVLQEEFYLNILGVLYSYITEYKLTSDDVTLGVLVPPRDYFNERKDILYAILTNTITIKNNITGDKVVLNLAKEQLVVKPESVVSFIACFIDDKNELTKAGEDYGDKLNVSIDLGHSTTDLAMMDDFSPQKFSFKTLDVATKQLLDYLSAELQRKFAGYIPAEKELIKAFSTGNLTMGAKKVWVGEELNIANKKFALDLYKAVFSYLRALGYNNQQVASYMFSGGGSAELKNVKSVRTYFAEEVHKVSEFTDTFTPREYLSVANHVDYSTTPEALAPERYANILGFLRGLRDLKTKNDEK